MRFVRTAIWEDVFEGWREREASNPGWIECATKVKGWPDWDSWRRFTASQIRADERKWGIFSFSDPFNEIPDMLIGPYNGWQSRVQNKNKATFEELLESQEQFEFFSKHSGVLSILEGLPFQTEFIGLMRTDTHKIVCIDGHHRATAITLARNLDKRIDFSNTAITIALAELSQSDSGLLDEILERGTSFLSKNG